MSEEQAYKTGEKWRLTIRGQPGRPVMYWSGPVRTYDGTTLELFDERSRTIIRVPISEIFLAQKLGPAPAAPAASERRGC